MKEENLVYYKHKDGSGDFGDFKHKFCINLNRRKNRWRNSFKNFSNNNITGVKRFIAEDHYDVKNKNIKINKGSYCLGLTIEKILLKAKERGYEEVLIFEDDVEFVENFEKLSENYLKDIYKYCSEWDMIYFGVNNIKTPMKINKNINKIKKGYTSHCMIIRDTVYDMILEKFNKYKYIKEIDVIYSEMHEYINAYTPSKALCVQREDFSDIEEKVVKKYVV
jgi:hypothetical protein